MNLPLSLASDPAEADVSGPAEGARAPLRRPLRDAWYCALPSVDLKAGATRSVSLLGEKVLLARRDDGSVFALRDRCPHRGVPFSNGRFDGREITCAFHGWRFNLEGRCTAMPALSVHDSSDPRQVSVGTFAVREAGGLVFVNMGREPDKAPPIPDLAAFGGLPKVTIVVDVAAGYDLTTLSLVDPAHVGHVHTSWWWRPPGTAREKTKDFEPSPFGFVMRAHKASVNSRLYRVLGGTPSTEIEFRLPGVRFERIVAGQHRVANVTYTTPLDTNVTRIVNVLYWTGGWLGAVTPLARPVVHAIGRVFLNQDKDILELAQKGLDQKPSMVVMGQVDELATWYISLKRAYLEARAADVPFVNPITPARLHWRT